jgi:hypothetical protein
MGQKGNGHWRCCHLAPVGTELPLPFFRVTETQGEPTSIHSLLPRRPMFPGQTHSLVGGTGTLFS